MKYHIFILALGFALSCIASVRADEKTDFLKSLVIPLSRAELRRLDSLFKAKDNAEAATNRTVANAIETQKAIILATPVTREALQKKAEALGVICVTAGQNARAANNALITASAK